MITTRVPDTWRDLQEQVAQILIESGFAVEIEKVISTVRGKVEIDVFAEEIVQGRRFTTLSECKYWRSAIPQAVIHGFRTVVGDIGANKGYIISVNGFQAGAFSAAELTNIELVTWLEFQTAFEPTWLTNFFAPKLLHDLGGLMTYAEEILPLWFSNLSKYDRRKYIALRETHGQLGWIAQHLAMHPITRSKQPFPALPLTASLAGKYDMKSVPKSVANATGYRELLEAMLVTGNGALEAFRLLRDNAT